MSVIDAIDNSPLFKMLTGIVMEAPGFLARGASSMLQGAAELVDSTVAGIGMMKDSLTTNVGMDRSDSSAVGQKLGRSAEFYNAPAAPERAGPNEYSLASLGNVEIPNVGAKGPQQSAGIMV